MPYPGVEEAKPDSDDDAGPHGEAPELRVRVGRNLLWARRLIDRNRTRIADDFGVLHTAWRKWEIGETFPDAGTMVAFCDRYHFTMDWIYRGRLSGLPEDLRTLLYRAHPELLEQQAEASPPRPGLAEARPDPRDMPPRSVPPTPATGYRSRKRRSPPKT